MTIGVLEQACPQTASHFLHAVLQIIHDDLGADQEREFITLLGTHESVLKDTAAKLSNGADEAKLLNDLDGYGVSLGGYYREIFRRIANSGKTHADN